MVQFSLVIIIVLAIVAWSLAHLFWHTKPTEVASFAALTARLRNGRPTLLYFYSNL